MMIALRPVPLEKEASFNRNTVSKAVAFIRRIAPLALVVITSGCFGQWPERSFVEIHKRHRAIVKWLQTFMQVSEPHWRLLVSLHAVKLNGQVNF